MKKYIAGLLILVAVVSSAYFLCRELTQAFLVWQIHTAIEQKGSDLHKFYTNSGHTTKDAYIAHGGGIKEYTYTNSREAVLDSLQKGFIFIEIDILETREPDGKNRLVGAHDWKHFKALLALQGDGEERKKEKALSIKDIAGRKIRQTQTPLVDNDIARIMQDNPQMILVTDKIGDHDLLLEKIPFPDRMIVEVFSPSAWLEAVQAGVRYPAFCIWNPKNLEQARRFRFPIVTMAASSFFREPALVSQIQSLHEAGVTILLFLAGFPEGDSPEFIRRHLGKTVSKIYTDNWSPLHMPQ